MKNCPGHDTCPFQAGTLGRDEFEAGRRTQSFAGVGTIFSSPGSWSLSVLSPNLKTVLRLKNALNYTRCSGDIKKNGIISMTLKD